jgi:hypothetical protein
MPSISRIAIMIGGNRGGGGGLLPSVLAKALYYSKISDIVGGEMPNLVTGATDFITVGGSAGSYTFQVPNTAPYIAADTDYIWFKTDASQRTTTEAELVGYDLPRTPVKYDSTSPYAIREILILKAGETLTTAEENNVRDVMWLSYWWSNVLSLHGQTKGNRGTGQNVWTPEEVFDAASIDLFDRLLVKGETPSAARKTAIDTAIKALKAADLFTNQFDVLVVTRGIGPYTRKENWIKDSHHGLAVANGGTFTETDDVGMHSDGTNSYLRTQYNPSTEGSLYKLNDACFGLKLSGTIGTGYHGAFNAAGYTAIYCGSALGTDSGINDASVAMNPQVGYNCLTRTSSTNTDRLINATTDPRTNTNSTQVINKELYIFRLNHTVPIGVGAAQIVEMYWLGKAITPAKFLTFQSIFDTYFSSL